MERRESRLFLLSDLLTTPSAEFASRRWPWPVGLQALGEKDHSCGARGSGSWETRVGKRPRQKRQGAVAARPG